MEVNELKNAVSTKPRVSELGKIAFSGPQNEENLLDCFHQLTSLFPSIDRPVSVNSPSSFRQ